jgi:hypothetical protein
MEELPSRAKLRQAKSCILRSCQSRRPAAVAQPDLIEGHYKRRKTNSSSTCPINWTVSLSPSRFKPRSSNGSNSNDESVGGEIDKHAQKALVSASREIGKHSKKALVSVSLDRHVRSISMRRRL